MDLAIQLAKSVICIWQDGGFQDLASTTALVEYVAAAHGDSVDQWNGRRIFKEATEGNKICMAGIDRMVEPPWERSGKYFTCCQSRSGYSWWRSWGARGYLKPKIAQP